LKNTQNKVVEIALKLQDNAGLALRIYAILKDFSLINFIHVSVMKIEQILLYAPLGEKRVFMKCM